MLTTQYLVEKCLTTYRDRVAVVDQYGEMTYGELDRRSARLANALLALGCSALRPVAILLPNDFHFVEIDTACMRAGIVRVGISTRLVPDECQFIVSHSEAAVLITSNALLARLDRGAMDGLKTILLVDEIDKVGDDGRIRNYEQTLAQGSASLVVNAVSADCPAYVLYTSGTTGRPKGATHTQGGRAAALLNMLASEIVATRNSTMVHCAPLTHGSGSKILTFMAVGARNLILPRFDPEEFGRAVEDRSGTHSFMVPTMLQMLLEAGEATCRRIRGMDQLCFGGAPISNALFGRALEGFGPILTQVYGSCEAPHPITVMRPEDYVDLPDPSALAESAGRAALAAELLILDDDGKALGAGGEGELMVRGDHLMRGYWNDDKATAEVLDQDGWYATGDIALMDDRGFVYFKDRKRDLIISGGLNIYPSEVERVLADHPVVREVAVIAYPDERWGESVLACIVANQGASVTESEIIQWTDGRIAGYKKPRKVIFMDDLPKGSTNKVLKRELKAKLWQGQSRRVN